MQGIYKITNLINNKIYIGKTNDSNRRWKDHQRLAFTINNKEYGKTLYKAMRKYGLENFQFDMIEELFDYNIAGEREKYWIKYYDSWQNGYNENQGGEGGSSKGHCLGEANGRAKLNKEDVIFIRTKYAEGISRKECYKFFKNKISESGFGRVWLGQTWKEIMPEVFTQQNKERNDKLGKSLAGKNTRSFSNEQVKQIRHLKAQNYTYEQIKKEMNLNTSISTLKRIVAKKTYQEVD